LPQNKKHIITKRLNEVSVLYLQGMPQYQIAKEVGVTQGQVSRDLKELSESWVKNSIANIDEIKAEQLAKLDLWEAEASEAWFESKNPEVTQQSEQNVLNDKVVGGEKRVYKKVKKGADARYIQLILTCIKQRCELLGIDSEVTVNFSQVNIPIINWVKKNG